MQRQTSLQKDVENTTTFHHEQVALEQERLRRAVEDHLLRRSGVRSTRIFHDETLAPPPEPKSSKANLGSVDFAIVPLRAAGQPSPAAMPSWRIGLRRVGEVSAIIGLDVRGDTIIGRTDSESPVDVNLDSLNAGSYGVSRRHALLRPTRHNLYLIDLESTNGTRCNGSRLRRGTVHVIDQGDTLSFGNLTFEVILLSDKHSQE